VNTPVPAVQLLSNGRYHLMVTAAGGGYSRCGQNALTRWREDATRDGWGAFVYVRDRESGRFWANARQPVFDPAARYGADFHDGRAVLHADTPDMDVRTHIAVSADDDVEIRRVRVTNRGDRARSMDLTSYAEAVLSRVADDDAHPAFNKLFVQTEIVDAQCAILCHRRPGGANPQVPWMFHAVLAGTAKGISYETDRMRFIGRGSTLADPCAVRDGTGPLSGAQGSVLDPVLAIRCPVDLPPGKSATVSYLYGMADTREACLALVKKYRGQGAIDDAFDGARRRHAQTLASLKMTQAQADLYCRLADSIVYNSALLRADPGVIASNQRGQPGLWGFSVSGDLPIVFLQLGAPPGLDLARQLLQAHAYWRAMGLPADLVIVNAQGVAVRKDLQKQVLDMLADTGQTGQVDQRGGIFVRLETQLAPEDRLLFQAVARVVLSDDAGTLAEQLGTGRTAAKTAAPALPRPRAGRRNAAQDAPAKAWAHETPARADTDAAPPDSGLLLDNGLGGFSPDGDEYVVTLAPGCVTPTPWVNVLANPRFGTIVSESGCANTWSENAHEFRLTPWSNDPVCDSSGEAFYIRDDETGEFWSPSPWPSRGGGAYVCRHGFGYSVFQHDQGGVESELTVYVARNQPIKFAVLKVRNRSGRARRLAATGYVDWVLGDQRVKTMAHVTTRTGPGGGTIVARNAYSMEFGDRYAFFGVDDDICSMTADRTEFLGRNGTPEHPAAMIAPALSGAVGAALDPCAAIQVPFELADGQEREIVFKLGSGLNETETLELIGRFRGADAAREAFDEISDYWKRTLGAVRIETPDPALNMLGNGWLVYQTLGCRVWARSAFYQPGGAFGFRDQLQDVMALVHTEPSLVRAHILLSASRQYPEGDVQHWWHPPKGRGVRTRCCDDYLWLALVTCRYVSATGDATILDEPVHFLTGRLLKPGEESYYELPGVSDDTAPLYEHCVRAIRHGFRMGGHGLPLMGTGDWNDGMNKVGEHGKGESVWMAFFLHHVLDRFKPIAQARGDAGFVQECDKVAEGLARGIDKHAWDGEWFLRAYFDDGSPLGASANAECKMGSIAQSWSVLSGAAAPARARQAMESLDRMLVDRDNAIIKLLDPPFDTSVPDPGYIRAYVPGVRENGGQYTHAAVWAAMAFSMLKDTRRAWDLLSILNPANHALSAESTQLYKVEPYVVASDVYSLPPHTGRGGWTWYSGSAGWLYRLMVESVLGLRREADKLYVEPCIPNDWPSFKIRYRFGASHYHILVRQQSQAAVTARLTVDGQACNTPAIDLVDDGGDHQVEVAFPAGAPEH